MYYKHTIAAQEQLKALALPELRTPKVQLKENVGPCPPVYELSILMTRGSLITNKLQIFSTEIFSRQEISISRY